MIEDENDFELVIFDCDGVLVDSEPLSLEALRIMLAKRDVELSTAQAAAAFQGISLADTRAHIEKVYNLTLTDEDIKIMHEGLFRQFEESLKPISGAFDFIKDLSIPYCVASSSGPFRIDLSLACTGLKTLFSDNLFSSTMVDKGKPEPDLFLYAADHMNFSASKKVCVIEDSVMGIKAAKRAGMTAIGFTAGTHLNTQKDSQALIDAGADWVVDSYSELSNLLKR